jgi:hypothetical protein
MGGHRARYWAARGVRFALFVPAGALEELNLSVLATLPALPVCGLRHAGNGAGRAASRHGR